jgi:hypothetical protein
MPLRSLIVVLHHLRYALKGFANFPLQKARLRPHWLTTLCRVKLHLPFLAFQIS